MKKTAFLILLMALCLLVAPFAVAESGPVARSDTFAAYTDGEGRLYLPGRAEACKALRNPSSPPMSGPRAWQAQTPPTT